MLPFALLLLAHLFGDFVLQTDSLVQEKRIIWPQNPDRPWLLKWIVKPSRALLIHVAHHWVLTVVATLIVCMSNHSSLSFVVWAPLLTVVTHLFIDTMKIIMTTQPSRAIQRTKGVPRSENKISPRDGSGKRRVTITGPKGLFLIDQLLHFFVILLIVRLYSTTDYEALSHFTSAVIAASPHSLTPLGRILALAITLICATSVSATVVQMIAIPPVDRPPERENVDVTFSDNASKGDSAQRERKDGEETTIADSQTVSETAATSYRSTVTGQTLGATIPKNSDLARRGRTIGYLERLILVAVIAMGSYAAITFIVAAKSLIRLKKFENADFAEYFLIGTLTSMLCGTICGLILRWVIL